MQNHHPEYIEKIYQFHITNNQMPERLDIFLTRSVFNATRTKVCKAIEGGNVSVNGKIPKPSQKIKPGDDIECRILKPPPIELIPENLSFDIIFEDETLLVVNKPAGMVTHPGFGNRYGTLVNALLYHFGVRDSVPVEYDDEEEECSEGMIFSSDAVRPGIVHRLDKDTSGLLVVTKNQTALAKLSMQFEKRTIDREYNALVWGSLKDDNGTIDADIGRSTRDRKLFAVVKKGGRKAITDYEVLERFDYLTLVKIKLKTGRTHQIRVHFSSINHPVFGDKDYSGNSVKYGGNKQHWKNFAENLLRIANRQMLHAKTLGFRHPNTNEKMYFTSDLPEDMISVIESLNKIYLA